MMMAGIPWGWDGGWGDVEREDGSHLRLSLEFVQCGASSFFWGSQVGEDLGLSGQSLVI